MGNQKEIKNPYQSCEKRKEAVEINSKLPEFYLGF